MSQDQLMSNLGIMLASGGCKNRKDLMKYKNYIESLKEKNVKQNPQKLGLRIKNSL